MKNILLIGAGNIGSRHLQGIMKVNKELEVCVVDPSQESILLTQNRIKESSENKSGKKIYYFNNFKIPQVFFDLCIIATTADVRLSVLSEVLERFKIKNLLLEKVLFQSVKDLDLAKKLIEKAQINAWVNCSRRMFYFYKELKRKYFSEGKEFKLSLKGDNWGLACNSIHFLDLSQWLSATINPKIYTDCIEKKIFDSKRAKFKEIFGSLVGKFNNVDVVLECGKNEEIAIELEFFLEDARIIVNEIKGYIEVFDKDGSVRNMIKIPLQSELTKIIVEQIFNAGICELTSFNESYILHKEFLSQLTVFINSFTDKGYDFCPIT